jgi:hypothetical protein
MSDASEFRMAGATFWSARAELPLEVAGDVPAESGTLGSSGAGTGAGTEVPGEVATRGGSPGIEATAAREDGACATDEGDEEEDGDDEEDGGEGAETGDMGSFVPPDPAERA